MLAKGCTDRATTITALPLEGVDPEAAQFAAAKAGVLVKVSTLMNATARAAEEAENLTSGSTWLSEYLFALGRHSSEGEQLWANAFKELLVSKATSFGESKVTVEQLSKAGDELATLVGQIQTIEMRTRISLSQRYGATFLSAAEMLHASRKKPKLLNMDVCRPFQDQLAADLIGKKIRTEAGGPWTFDAPSEYRSFGVLRGTNYGGLTDYVVQTDVAGMFSGIRHRFVLLLTYEDDNGKQSLRMVRRL